MLLIDMEAKERQRLEAQRRLDGEKTQGERNRSGQFATPTALAMDMLAYAQSLLPPDQKIRFLDPAIGTGSFFSALLRTFPAERIANAVGYEIDRDHANQALGIWGNELLNLHITDFTRSTPPKMDDAKANLLICNPPYVRHHHLSRDDKQRLQKLVEQYAHIKLSGLAGLYCYFLGIAHAWIAENGIAGWLIPSEFMDVNYGEQIKQYLLDHVTLLRIHRFNPTDLQFQDALVSSSMIWFKKAEPPANHTVESSYGGTLAAPEISNSISTRILRSTPKWTRLPFVEDAKKHQIPSATWLDSRSEKDGLILSDLFEIKRGIATGANKYFLLHEDQFTRYAIPSEFLTPVLPGPRYLISNEIHADNLGNPLLDQRLFLLTCDLPEEEVKLRYPSVWQYLQKGKEAGIDQTYLCTHRSPWYVQEKRPASPFLCTYMGRHSASGRKPFRFILNHSRATAANVYLLLYPKPFLLQEIKSRPELATFIWQHLNDLSSDTLKDQGRVYGDGLYKLEPRELANISIDSLSHLLTNRLTIPSQISFDFA